MSKKPTLGLVDDLEMPVTVGNPAAADALAIDQSHIEEFANAEEASDVRCRKPPKGIYFTVLPEKGKPWENRAFYWLLELEGHDPYIVAPGVAKQKKDEDVIRPILIVRYVTMAGDEGLWPLKLDVSDARTNPFNKSALTVLEIASSGKWVRLISGKGHYKHQISKKTLEQVVPKFTDRPFRELFDIAFKDRIINSLDHEIWTILDQGSEK
jgi:hypothetical protein